MVTVRSYPRIHIGLLDLGGATFRKYGGAGFSLASLPIEVEALISSRHFIFGLEKLDKQGQKDILSVIETIRNKFSHKEVEIMIKSVPPQHVGLGSKTALLLALLQAVNIVMELKLSNRIIQLLSGRGGTSGIGVNAFFKGGFLIDGGHDPHSTVGFGPSSARRNPDVTLIISRIKIPDSWHFSLLLPPGERMYGKRECSFFDENTPIPKLEVLKSLSLVYHGIAPAFLKKDLSLLKVSLAELHKIGFKKRELKIQSDVTQKIMKVFDNVPNCGIGLSGMGPLLYVVSHKRDFLVSKVVDNICQIFDVRLLGTFKGRNKGYEVIR